MVLLLLKLPVKLTSTLISKLLQAALTFTRLLTRIGVPVTPPLSLIRKVHTLMSHPIQVLLLSLNSSDSIAVMLSILCLLQFATFLASLSKTSFVTLKKLWQCLLSLRRSHAASLSPEQQQQLLQLLNPPQQQAPKIEEVNSNAEQSYNVRS